MRAMTITMTGCKLVPSWVTLEAAVSQATDEKGKFTRIARRDGASNYRDPGEYEVTFTTDKCDSIAIKLDVRN